MASGWVDWMCLVRDALLGASRSTILFGLVSTRKGLGGKADDPVQRWSLLDFLMLSRKD